MIGSICAGLVTLVALYAANSVVADANRTLALRIIQPGIYFAESDVTNKAPGTLAKVQNPRLALATTVIPINQGVRFGLRYVLSGAPHGATFELRLVTRFPNGGLLEPHTNTRRFEQEYFIKKTIGSAGYREFHLDENWERVPGLWTFEFWHGAQKIGEQEFCLFETVQSSRTEERASDCRPFLGM